MTKYFQKNSISDLGPKKKEEAEEERKREDNEMKMEKKTVWNNIGFIHFGGFQKAYLNFIYRILGARNEYSKSFFRIT